jgi:small-conductance mechanosensitive channel
MNISNLEELLKYAVLGNTLDRWFLALATFLCALVALWIVRGFGSRLLAKLTERTKSRMDDLLPILVRKTHVLFFALLSAFAGLSFLETSRGVSALSQKALMLALVLQAGVWANHAVAFLFDRLSERDDGTDGSRQTSLMALRMLSRGAVWLLVAMLLLENLGFNMSAIITGLGIGGIAVALAVQNVLGDLLASLSIVLDKPFVVGDAVVIDDLAGTIEQIGVKTTRVRSLSGEQLVFSNADLLKARIRNFKRMQERRVLFAVGVTYDTPLAKLEKIPEWLEVIVKNQSLVRFDRAHFRDLGPHSLNFEVVYFLLSSDFKIHMDVQQSINFAIMEKFEAERVDFAFPTQTLHLAK